MCVCVCVGGGGRGGGVLGQMHLRIVTGTYICAMDNYFDTATCQLFFN